MIPVPAVDTRNLTNFHCSFVDFACTIPTAVVSVTADVNQLAPLSLNSRVSVAGVVCAEQSAYMFISLHPSIPYVPVVLLRVFGTIVLSRNLLICKPGAELCSRFTERVNDGVVPVSVCTYLTRFPRRRIGGDRYIPVAVILSKSYTRTQFVPPSSDSSIHISSVGFVPDTAVTGIETV